ncbi:hypothetical protein LCGC14_1559700 [marine sediment metagenome]|uniref:Uncharacterized protein n=2 Tax=root TaxID=1 RepID=A0A0F9IMW1_9ZZZZ|nr:MAG: hypothetical protein LCMAC202_04260 [Marseillevirus LCMAC202]
MIHKEHQQTTSSSPADFLCVGCSAVGHAYCFSSEDAIQPFSRIFYWSEQSCLPNCTLKLFLASQEKCQWVHPEKVKKAYMDRDWFRNNEKYTKYMTTYILCKNNYFHSMTNNHKFLWNGSGGQLIFPSLNDVF